MKLEELLKQLAKQEHKLNDTQLAFVRELTAKQEQTRLPFTAGEAFFIKTIHEEVLGDGP